MRTSRTGAPATNPVSDDEIRSLLDRYRCPMPFHVVRTWLLGNIASPDMTASPTDTVAGLWGGELPAINLNPAVGWALRCVTWDGQPGIAFQAGSSRMGGSSCRPCR